MRDWTGSTIQADALRVPCRFCNALAGQPCVNKGSGAELHAFPAHTGRIADSTPDATVVPLRATQPQETASEADA